MVTAEAKTSSTRDSEASDHTDGFCVKWPE